MRLVVAVALLAVAHAADATVCKYVDSEGAHHYSNVAPDKGWRLLTCDTADEVPLKARPKVPRKTEAQMTPAEKEKAWQAVQTCQAAIQLSLHDPKSAEYPSVSRSYRAMEKDAYVVQVEVRARNGFNALRLNTMECSIDAATGKFKAMRKVD